MQENFVKPKILSILDNDSADLMKTRVLYILHNLSRK